MDDLRLDMFSCDFCSHASDATIKCEIAFGTLDLKLKKIADTKSAIRCSWMHVNTPTDIQGSKKSYSQI